MVIVAVAGGTSPTLGRSIVQALVNSSKHEAIILSRGQKDADSTSTESTPSKWGAPIKYVDYNDVQSLTSALNGVHTLISVVASSDPATTRDTHKNMLIACSANGVQRFYLSDWGLGPLAHTQITVLASKAQLSQLSHDENTRQLGQTGQGDLEGKLHPNHLVECCTIHLGCFMGYFVQGYDKTTRPPHLDGGLIHDLLDDYVKISEDKLTIPLGAAGDDGGRGAALSLTDINDVGPLVVATLDLPPGKMKGQLGCTSDTSSFAQIREILTDKCKLDIPYKTISKEECTRIDKEVGQAFTAKMQQGQFDVELLKSQMVAQIYGLLCDGAVNGSVIPPQVNNMLAEAGIVIPTTKTEDLLVQAWGLTSS